MDLANNPMLQSMLENMDPNMKMLMEQMMQQRQQQDNGDKALLDKYKMQLQRMRDNNQQLQQQLSTSDEQLTIMTRHVEYLLRLNNSVAAALGACECWGEDLQCPHCKGEGEPGYKSVNQRYFRLYVQPCLEKMQVAAHKGPNGKTFPPDTNPFINN
jgi:hypothetical protein